MQTIEQMKADAKRLRSFCKSIDISISVAQSLEAVAAQREFRDWNTAVAAAKKDSALQPNVIAEGLASADVGNLTSLDQIKAKWAKATVCVTADMSSDEVMEEIEDCLRIDPHKICLRIDAAVSGTKLRDLLRIARELGDTKGIEVYVDSPL